MFLLFSFFWPMGGFLSSTRAGLKIGKERLTELRRTNRAYRDIFLELTQKTLGLSEDKKTEMKNPKQIKEKTKKKKEG